MYINVTTKAIEMAKSEHRAAHTYGTTQYEELQEVRKAYPGFKVVIKERKRTDRLKGLNEAYMAKYIKDHDDEQQTIWKEFCELRGTDENGKKKELSGAASFGELRMWFLNRFPEIENMSASVDAILAKARKERAEKRTKAKEAKPALTLV